MMKKVLYGVALTLFASVSVGSLQSCKDDLNDVQTQTSFNLSKLNAQLSKKLQDLDTTLAAGLAKKADIDYVNQIKGELLEADSLLAHRIDGVTSRIDSIDQLLKDSYATKEYVEEKANALMEEIKALKQIVQEGDEALESLIRETQEALTQVINMHAADIEEINNRLETIETALDNIITRLDNQVTGILIQGVSSPVFGEFSLPLGVKSNILFNWYGYNAYEKDVKFPNKVSELSATGSLEDFNINSLGLGPNGANDFAVIPAASYYPAEVNLGTVYVTLNPIGNKFNDTPLSIVNSQGAPLPFKVTLKESDKVLTYGYTRSNISKGLYEGDAILDPANDDERAAVEYTLDDQFKAAMKNVLKDPSKQSAVGLLKALYEQMGNKLPAYGLMYGWNNALEDETDPGFSANSYAVLSQYDLAVATSQPFGFTVFDGIHGSAKLPVISNLDNFISELVKENLDNLDIKGEDMTVLGHKIGFKNGKVEFKEVNGELVATVTGVTVDGKPIVVDPKVCESPESASADVSDAIAEAVIKAIGATSESDRAAVKTSIDIALLQMQKQINEVLEKVNGQIKSTFENMADKADSYLNKASRLVDLYNKVATKINNFLTNPHHYVQVAAFYEQNNNVGVVSGDVKYPTVFTQAGGDAIDIFLSTYTAELIVPAFQKFVACTGAYNKDGSQDTSFKPGDVNKEVSDLCKVLPGHRLRVVIPAKGLDADKVYEFTYQAIDYTGHTSTTKFYIEVK